jgi:hypothetical protein
MSFFYLRISTIALKLRSKIPKPLLSPITIPAMVTLLSLFFEIKGRSSATQLSKIKRLEFYVQVAPPGAKHDGPRTKIGDQRRSNPAAKKDSPSNIHRPTSLHYILFC